MSFNRKIALTIAAIAMLTAHGLSQDLPPPAEVPDFLKSQYQQNISRFLRDVLIEAEEKQYGEQGEVILHERYTYKAGRQRFLFTTDDSKQPGQWKQIWAGGPEGYFLIKPSADRSGNVITASLPADDVLFHDFCRADMGVGLQLASFEVPHYHYMSLPDLHVESVSRERWNNTDAVCIVTRRSLKGGVLERYYFDPAHYWVYLGSRRIMAQGNGDEVVSQVNYADDGTTPQSWEYKLVKKQGGEKKLRDVFITKYQKEEFPESDFSLTQFGLPDPVGYSPAPGRFQSVWPWLAIAAVCAILMFTFRYLKQQSAKVTP